MICFNPDLETKVDLFTCSRELEELMLNDFPGIIKGEQHEVKKIDNGNKVYCFYDLNEQELIRFIGTYARDYEFEIRDHSTGEVIFTRDNSHK